MEITTGEDPYQPPASGEPQDPPAAKRVLSERWILLLLAAVQFTHVMDFMVMMPLGPQLQRELHVTPAQFGNFISSFAITAGVVGLLTAPFMDRFDRRKLLLMAYAGFTVGTLACGFSQTPGMLLAARALCGAFGGISGAAIMAIVADVVPPERRARGMGIIMTAFSFAAAIGVPIGLQLAVSWRWEAPFLLVGTIAVLVWTCLYRVLPPVRGHLTGEKARSGRDFLVLLQDGNAWRGMLLMVLMVFGHFTIIPYLSTHLVGNVGMPENRLFLVYLTGGLVTIFTGPWVGKMADLHGRFKVYILLVAGASVVVHILTTSGPRPVWQVMVLSAFFFAFASSRFIPGQAVISQAVPSKRRGAYMSLVGCSRDLASGIATALGGLVVAQGPDASLLHFDILGWAAIGVSLLSLFFFRLVKPVA